MSAISKRKGFSAYGGLVSSNLSNSGVITNIGTSSGTITLNNNPPTAGNAITLNGTTITNTPYITNGTVYGYYDYSAVEYKSLAPEAVHHRASGKRLIVWEP